MHRKKPTVLLTLMIAIFCVMIAVCFLSKQLQQPTLPLIHSQIYAPSSTEYENSTMHYTKKNPEAVLRYFVTEDMHLQVMYHPVSISPEIDLGLAEGEWVDLGKLEAVELTKDNFDERCHTANSGAWRIQDIRKEAANAWQLRTENDELIYLIQSKDDERRIAIGDCNHDREQEPLIRYIYSLKIDQFSEYGLHVSSGDNTVPIAVFPANIPIGNYDRCIYWLAIASGEDFCPFRIYRNGEELRGFYQVYDAETYETVPYHIPSGLDPQTYLFQNCDPGREYIVVMKLSTDPDATVYCFGVRFLIAD